jgi:hypothetical protein
MTNKLSKLVIGLLAAFAFASLASAAPAQNTESSTSAIGNLDNKLTFTDKNDSIDKNTTFNDVFTFKLTSPETLVTLDLISDPKGNGKSFSSLSLSLTEDKPTSTTLLQPSQANSYQFNNLGPGKYTVDISGVTSGKGGGMYSFSAIAAPVPEPSEGALLLSGVGMLGFIAARRNNNA